MRYSPLVVAAATFLVCTATAAAQQAAKPERLEVGAWTGKVTPPEGHTTDVLYDVSYAGDTLKIKIDAGQHGSFETYEVKHEANKISFKFRPGPEVVCVLEKKDASYAGVCTEDDGTAATMDMSPPRKTEAKKD